MATILREWSYRYQWLYDTVSKLAAISVGGDYRFRRLFLRDLDIQPDTKVLDLCCGSGQATEILVQYSQDVTGLDASPLSLKRAKKNVPQAQYIQAFAEEMPFSDCLFDLVLTNTAMHEMQPDQLKQIFKEVYRVLKPNGTFAIVDFHKSNHWFFKAGVTIFFQLFETETAWQFIDTDVSKLLTETGFTNISDRLYAGNSLQVIQGLKLNS
ncbi:methylase involved in ubiquinone/menaquinone biosynthesis [Synechococcus sp. PCC 7502]|uniref:class I SAM-dependent methyltransferase n=1 Tax=Synechococcus sp. PCC 7502 TaxID=1173263 RepID=UPI00029F8754|nr:class I SAM-dependent methyltransferase [Synechococcus sp. PCC 7502]AFY72674.1 methylase involved in ubiquinone/menaquinone biosynthesis [Synechococcus sp. PCC 7502]